MKKVLLLAAVVALGFTSCSKGDYTCTCEFDFLGTVSTSESTFEGVKEDEAQDACDALGALSTTTCTLKDA